VRWLPNPIPAPAFSLTGAQEHSSLRLDGTRLGFALLIALLVPALALTAERVPKPAINIEKPGRCVEDTATMRRGHPDMLRHQRDLTVRDGIRTRQHSLQGCIECHASARTGSVLGDKGFCQSCHDYAGVKLDCFECHTSRPKLATGAKP